MNELIFLAQTLFVSTACLAATRLGKEALVALICLLGVLSNLFVIKQITLFGLHVTAADAFSVGALLGLNLLQEYFGKGIAKKTVWICFFILLLYTGFAQIHLWFLPSLWDTAHPHFQSLFQFAPRITTASLLVYLFVQHLDRYLYAKLQDRFGQSYLLTRNYILLMFSQLVDTVLFSFLGLWGIVESVTHVIVISYLVKLVAIFVATPFVKLSATMVTPQKRHHR
ncbi:queuosine precursor transporter [Candidatus Dependentiae bacterium]